MKTVFFTSIALIALTVLGACAKKDDPFEYPDGEITQPTVVTQMTRVIAEDENWAVENVADGCDENFPAKTFAISELSYTRGFATLYLVPDSIACSPYVSASTPIGSDEVASDYWDNWKFELTFSELQLNEASELRLQLAYREVEIDLDLAPFMRETIAPDTAVNTDVSGLFSFDIQQGYTNFLLNGMRWEPDFSEASGNLFNQNAAVDEPSIKLTLSSEGTEARSLIVFTYIRVSSYGVPEQ